ncbi:MAG: Probable Co/Zn/Cd efflux system membrane fusion protein [uncultured Sphingomonadaceae bacterium]|uniref:Probable Co/Zn/Cd efflux system membrane fusion protein n=1 Tax=uncultured Sphingomonadaceae bacterium TaxID=169976 RepID=A0A6J4SEG6_9SPHN|nr:MAG: Probable Co/Zn/Cd efflux system membrane fusion protein [uncultured Sphingomonadaceae bacterium]
MDIAAGQLTGAPPELIVVEDAKRDRRRRILLVVGALVLLVAAILGAAWAMSDDEAAAAGEAKGGAAKGGAGGRGQQQPAVTVVVPGRAQVASVINATGTVAARRDTAVGVVGEGGQVTRVTVDAGAFVGRGQVLAVIERSVQQQQQAQVAAQIQVARADAALAQNELDRALALVSRGFVSKADVDRRRAARDAARARVTLAEAQLGEQRARIGRLDIRAPVAGLVLARSVEPGAVVTPGSGTLFRLAAGGEMEMVAQLSEADLAKVRVGVPATVTPVGSTRSFAGSVWQVSPVIDPATRQGQVRISVPYDPALRPGGFAQASIRAGQVDAPVLPQSAVLSDDKGSFVYVVAPDGTVARRDIQVGNVDNRGVTIASGLSGAETVVLSAGPFLNPGQKIVPRRQSAR